MTRDEIEKLLAATTPGPWGYDAESRCVYLADDKHEPNICGLSMFEHEPEAHFSGYLIAAAPDLARLCLSLMDQLAEAKAQVAGFREAITDARDNCPEVNLRNYDADDVERMNDAAGRVYDILNAALAAAEGAKG